MKRFIAIMLMSLFMGGCSLGVPVIDDQAVQDFGNAEGSGDRPDRGRSKGKR